MKRNLRVKLGIIAVVIGLSIFSYYLRGIKMGLDLRGGMHLVLGVEVEEAVQGTLQRYTAEVKDTLRIKRIRYQDVSLDDNQRLHIELRNQKSIADVEDLVAEYPSLKLVRSDPEKGILIYTMGERYVQEAKEKAVEQALQTIRNRIDQFGVSEPTIQRQGENRILVQLPDIKDPDRALELIGKTALLEFKLVDEGHDIAKALKGRKIEGSEILYEVKRDKETGDVISRRPLLVKKRTVLTGASLTDARVSIDSQYNEAFVSLTFDSSGARQFERVTGENVGRRLAIVLDGTIYSAPVVQEKISGGKARITGYFTMDEAKTLAIALRSGALPAPVTILENRTVGPSLGQDSVHQGIKAIVIGGLLVVVFMVLYYGFSGIIADVALLFNFIIIVGALSYLGATLTLPGIAGIILTIGMAVDANVLIFERIREELRLGKTVRAAVGSGFDRALITILDANITTLIAGLVLFQFGTGPVKGFAVTLSLGILGTLFTALFVSRTFFDSIMARPRVQKISI